MNIDDDGGDFFLDWYTWICVTHADLMKFHLFDKSKDDRNNKWDHNHHVGRYKQHAPEEFHRYYPTNATPTKVSEQVEHEKEHEDRQDGQEEETSHHTSSEDDALGLKTPPVIYT